MESQSNKVWTVVVIGGGIVGICSALALKERGVDVALIDPLDEHRRASFGNAGVVSCGSILPMAGPHVPSRALGYLLGQDPSVRIRKRSLVANLPWARSFLAHCNSASRDQAANHLVPLTRGAWAAHQTLAKKTRTESLLAHRGWIRLYRDSAAWNSALAERNLLRDHGVALTDLNAAQLRETEPALAHRYVAGSMIDDAGAVSRPDELIRACYRRYADLGGVILRTRCQEITLKESAIALLMQGSEVAAKSVVIAAGAWSGNLLRRLSGPLNIRLPLAAERGYHQQLRQRPGALLTRPVYDTAGGFVIAPASSAGDVRVLSGVELATPDVAPNYQMLSRVVADARLALALEPELTNEPWMGSRPSTPDGLPIIGAIQKDPRIICAFGHGHIGFSTGPLAGQIVAGLVQREPASLDLGAFAPERFN